MGISVNLCTMPEVPAPKQQAQEPPKDEKPAAQQQPPQPKEKLSLKNRK